MIERDWYRGCAPAFQAVDKGSNPLSRSITMSYFDMPKTYELKAEYEVASYFWPRKKYEWKVFWRNPWRYWRSHVLKEKIIKRFSEQIRKSIDDEIIAQIVAEDNTTKQTPHKPITGIVNHEIL